MNPPVLAGKILNETLNLGVEDATAIVGANSRKMIKVVNNEVATTMRRKRNKGLASI